MCFCTETFEFKVRVSIKLPELLAPVYLSLDEREYHKNISRSVKRESVSLFLVSFNRREIKVAVDAISRLALYVCSRLINRLAINEGVGFDIYRVREVGETS